MLVAHVLPRNPQKSQKLGRVSGCVGMAGCHTLLIRENPCVLWDALSSKKVSVCSVHSVGILMFSHRSHGLTQMLVAHVLPRNPQKSQKLGRVSGCVGMAGCHTLLIRENPCVLWDALSSKKVSVCSVHSVGILMFSHRSHGLTQMLVAHVLPRNPQKSQKLGRVSGCVGMAGCHTLLIRENPCNLWETLLFKKFPCILWEY